jgi:hypothetical protein
MMEVSIPWVNECLEEHNNHEGTHALYGGVLAVTMESN